MISTEFRLLILASAALAAIAMFRARRDIRADWNDSATIVFGLAWLLNSRHIAAVVSGDFRLSYNRLADKSTAVVVYGPTADLVYHACLLVAAVLGGGYLAHRLLSHPRLNPAGVVALILLGLAALSSWWNDGAIDGRGFALMAVILGLAVVLEPGRGARVGAALFGVSLTVVSGALLLWRADGASRLCGINKCGLLDVLYTGIFENANAFGLSLALALPFVLHTFTGNTRLIVAAAMTMAVLGAESRTAQIAMAVTLSVFLLSRVSRKVVPLAAIGLGLASAVLPFAEAHEYSKGLTGRAHAWHIAISGWVEQWLIGHGSEGWAQLREEGRIIDVAVYSPHNQWLDMLYAVGVLGALCFAWLLVTMYKEASDPDQPIVGLILVAVLTVGLTERAWGVSAPDWLYWSLLAGCLAGAPRGRSDRYPVGSVTDVGSGGSRSQTGRFHGASSGSNGHR